MRTLVAALLSATLFASPALVAEDKKEDGDHFQGTWEVIKLECVGRELIASVKDSPPTVMFDGKKYTITTGDVVEKGEFQLDPKAKTPTVDLTILEGKAKGKKQLGIYKLDGDTLTICLGREGGDDRPTKFTTAADAPEFVMLTLKRKKKD